MRWCTLGQSRWTPAVVAAIVLLHTMMPAHSSRTIVDDIMARVLLGDPQQPSEPLVLTSEQLNCTARDFANLVYRGRECHNRDVWPGQRCPSASACLPLCSRCVTWRRGELDLTRRSLARSTNTLTADGAAADSVPIRCDSTIWGFGRWINDTWVPSEKHPQCSPAQLTPEAIYDCLRGKRVLLFGDSTIRPLLGRLVAHLRSLPEFIDRLHHEPGSYYMANGTHDAFVIGGVLPSLFASVRGRRTNFTQHHASLPETRWERRATMELQYYWAPRFVHEGPAPALHEHLGALEGADIVIAGPMYHVHGDYETFRDALLYYFKLLAQVGKRITQFFWLSTMPKGGNVTVDIQERNYHMESLVHMLNDQAYQGESWPPRHSYFVDTMRMSVSGNITRRDLYHYQCVVPEIFTNISRLNGAENNTNCRDPFNLNVIQSILKVACSR